MFDNELIELELTKNEHEINISIDIEFCSRGKYVKATRDEPAEEPEYFIKRITIIDHECIEFKKIPIIKDMIDQYIVEHTDYRR